MQNQGKSLSETFVPKTLIRKASLKNTNPILQKNQFQKTQGNLYVELDPPQIKFNGYELNKINTLSFKIINKAPIPQRFNILAPIQANFSIKVNKKGSIPTGMYQTVQVFFKSSQFKYMYDVVKINTETQNFVVPLYAYPTIPNLNLVFPKLLDFGHVDLKQTESYFYPIKNPTPIDFQFQFMYKIECSQIMINPLDGNIPGNGEVVVEIAFIPNRKQTYSSEVYFRLKQFDFQPIFIKIIGNGKDKQLGSTIKRLKSSRLVPLKQKQEDKQKQTQKQRMNQTQSFLNSKIKDQKKQSLRPNMIRKSNAKITYPKLLNSTSKFQSSVNQNNQSLLHNINQNQKTNLGSSLKNSQQRIFLNRFNKVKQLDKQKQIKFSQFIGDPAMTLQQINDQKHIKKQTSDLLNKLLRQQSQQRINPQKKDSADVEYKKFNKEKFQLTWDQNKNDQLYERRVVLNRFVLVASKIIEVKRMLKRLQKIKQFIGESNTKEEVAKKVEQSYQKSLDFHCGYGVVGQINFQFNRDSIIPSYFQLQYGSGVQKASNKLFQTVGKTQFDDLTSIQLIEPKQNQKLFYKQIQFPLDFVNVRKLSPFLRVSGQQQFSIKSSSLPYIQPFQSYEILAKALDIPNHYFIYSSENIVRFQNYNATDQKDPLFVLSQQKPIQDEFQGWTKGDYYILKHKLLKNTGIQFNGFSSYNYTSKNDIGFYGDIAKHLPEFIDKPCKDDHLENDDSDDEKYEEGALETESQFLKKVETSNQIKQRRQKGILDQDGLLRKKMEKNINKNKVNLSTYYVAKVKDLNKWIDKDQNKLIF